MFSLDDLRLPILLAPMAGGFTTPALAAGVVAGGGLAGLGLAYATAERVDAELRAVRALCPGPLNANFFVFPSPQDPGAGRMGEAAAALARLPGLAGVDIPTPRPPFVPDLDGQLEPVWAHRPEVLSFHLGVPPQHVVQRAHALGICVAASATSLAEARALAGAGVDLVVAQGVEAGGHRGVFDPAAVDEQLGTLDLVRQLAPALPVPVVAAGGIMDGAGVRAALAAGAKAAQMGTAFLSCPESGASPAHRRLLLEEHGRGTRFTTAYSGRPARGIVTGFMQAMAAAAILPFPLQNTLTGPMRQAAVRRDDGEYQSLWAGANYKHSRPLPVRALMDRLAAELGSGS